LLAHFGPALKTESARVNGLKEQLAPLQAKQDYLGVVDHLLSLQTEIYELPSTHAKQEFTIHRFYLLLINLLSNAERMGKQEDRLSKSIENSVDLLVKSPHLLAVKLNM